MADEERPVAVDIFCGAGGMSLGFEQAGFRVAGAVDYERIHLKTYEDNFPGTETFLGDLSVASGDALRKKLKLGSTHIDVLFGGSPCQGFSYMGKHDADDPRNGLFLDFARLARELGPTYFVVENVPGLLAEGAESYVESFVGTVRGAGYDIVEPIRVLDASNFGVPQRRKRAFILGFKKGATPPKYPSDVTSTNGSNLPSPPSVWDAIGDLPDLEDQANITEDGAFLGALMDASAYAAVMRADPPAESDQALHRNLNGTGLTGCKGTAHTKEVVARFEATSPGKSEQISRFYRLSKSGLATTLRAGTGPDKGSFMAPRPIHPVKPRCITVREAARLHSFPDWFQFHKTKWHAFRQIGNSVPPLLSRSVAMSILSARESNCD